MVIFRLLVNRRNSSKYICSRLYTCMPVSTSISFHSFLLIFVILWPISTLCVADMVHCMLWPMWFVDDTVVSRRGSLSLNSIFNIFSGRSTGAENQSGGNAK